MSAPKFIINNIERISITLVVYVVGLIENLLNIKIYRIRADRIGHLALNHDLFFRRVNAGILDNQKFILVGPMEDNSHWVANKTLYRLIKNEAIKNSKIIFICSSIIYKLLSASSAKIKESGINVELEIHSNEVEFSLYDRVLYLSKHDKQRGWNKIKFLNIPDKSKIVCVFARDSAYLYMKDGLRDWSYHDYRDTEIDDYKLAAQYLVEQGYYVIRMGATVNKPFACDSDKIIDYAYENMRTDFMDIYLGLKCHFCISTSTGYDAVPSLFRRPLVVVNNPHIEYIYSFFPKTITIFKKVFNIDTREYLSIKNILDSGVGRFDRTNQFVESKLKLIDNTPEEIRDAVVEMVLKLDKEWSDQWYDDNVKDRVDQFYSASQLNGKILSRFGTKFIKENIYLISK